MKRLVLTICMLIMLSFGASAQCAMCRSTLENNFSNGDPGIAAGINTGILYLLLLPYIVVAVVGFLWYKSTRDAKNKLGESTA